MSMIDKLDKLSTREQVGLVLAVACLLAFGVERLLVQRMVKEYHDLSQQIETKERELKLNRLIISRKKAIEAEYSNVEQLLRKPPSEAEAIAQMKRRVDSLADAMGVTLKSRDHLEPRHRKFFDEYAVDLKDFEAGLEEFLRFMYSLSSLRTEPGMLQIASLTVSPKKNSGSVEGSMLVTKVMTPADESSGETDSR